MILVSAHINSECCLFRYSGSGTCSGYSKCTHCFNDSHINRYTVSNTVNRYVSTKLDSCAEIISMHYVGTLSADSELTAWFDITVGNDDMGCSSIGNGFSVCRLECVATESNYP